MSRGEYVIRTMTRDEVDIAMAWAAAEGWNPGLHDAACFHAADPDGFLVGVLDGEIIGTVSGVVYGDAYAFLGLYIVQPKFRGQGYGIQLARAAERHMAGCNIGLDGVLEQQDTYREKGGYQYAYRNIRYEAVATGGRQRGPHVTDLSGVPFEDLAAYDRELFGAPRRAFLRCWIGQPGTCALAATQEGRLVGYGVIRPCHVGYKIGPLFADDADLAEELYGALAAQPEKGAPIYLDPPQVNEAAVALAQRHNMAKVFETARMYSQGPPDIPLDRWFGVTSFELG